ncbi:ammonium transporter [Sphingomonas sp.]|uniref:ammonium transporter n=1 Tax=Sphingomonas sp. TaxID=28214 RepID=UPI001EC9FD7C|nr:ammonium transporter [Sphingomonas sp.]MBX3594950.1 ammonium transporter [Sphingomonas sp.]
MNKEVVGSLAIAGGILVLALAGLAARKLGYADGETVKRMVIGANGLLIAWLGNMMPKRFVPGAGARKVQRVGGWSLLLSGLVYAGAYAFAPIEWTTLIACSAVAIGMAITIGYCLTLRAQARAS